MDHKNLSFSRRKLLKGFAGIGVASLAPSLVFAKAGENYFELTAGLSEQKLYNEDSEASNLWTYNGTAPGPEIRLKKGQRIKVKFTNNLEEPTSVHWHGIRIDNAMDGVSGLTQQPVMPGESFLYDFITPDAGTYWYHAHNRSWNEVARGLYGPLIVEEDESIFDQEHDLTFVVDDWRLGPNGALDVASLGSLMDWSHAGRLGNWLMTNGKITPSQTLNAGEHYRLRFINASNSRVLEINPNDIGALVIGYDGQMLQEAYKVPYSPLLLGPAQRVDLLFTPKSGKEYALEEISGNKPYPFLRFQIDGDKEPNERPRLPGPNSIPEPSLENAKKFKLNMTGGAMAPLGNAVYQGQKLEGELIRQSRQVWAFNGVANMADEPFFSIDQNETVIIEVTNQTAFLHAMHVHGHHFRVIERSESDINEGKPWRDTFMIGPEQTTKIAFVADNPGKWLFHCHMLEHAAAGMTTWFEVS